MRPVETGFMIEVANPYMNKVYRLTISRRAKNKKPRITAGPLTNATKKQNSYPNSHGVLLSELYTGCLRKQVFEDLKCQTWVRTSLACLHDHTDKTLKCRFLTGFVVGNHLLIPGDHTLDKRFECISIILLHKTILLCKRFW